ncbi:hypothetical protein QR680_015447 [Steinernema hermaphroditum]|uniref:Protein kinase domain-containing protein n=1 Tax=Steinernema hermaphroditum TaxID=289476 RepID=A0AA39H8R8_9BILA|nr:hypothetical protein QR680_015447 [Steinernema hermaphroditum]
MIPNDDFDSMRSPCCWADLLIPFGEIGFDEKGLIGKGRFGDVYRAKFHGDVAIKFLNMDHVEQDCLLEEFKAEVAPFKITRHENIVLFLGYCCSPTLGPGIVMPFCKGSSLYSLIHEPPRSSSPGSGPLDLLHINNYAIQICRGVAYLHSRRIVHRDLRSKNIFVEKNNKIVITDFGIFSRIRLAQTRIASPDHWVCYAAPELINAVISNDAELPFSESSDVFAFGTVWFELITQTFPYADQDDHMIAWRASNGMFPVPTKFVTREEKAVLRRCWSIHPQERSKFKQLVEMLHQTPKRLSRRHTAKSLRPGSMSVDASPPMDVIHRWKSAKSE